MYFHCLISVSVTTFDDIEYESVIADFDVSMKARRGLIWVSVRDSDLTSEICSRYLGASVPVSSYDIIS